jgi:hypothetical protein
VNLPRRPLSVPLGFLLALAAALGLSLPSSPAALEEYLQLRVRQAGVDSFFTAPRALVQRMARTPTGTTVSLGRLNGKDVRLSVDRLLRALAAVPPAAEGETHLLTRASDAGAIFFFGKPEKKPAAARASAILMDFRLTKKGPEASTTHLKLPLMGTSTVLQAVISALGLQPGSDLGPLFDSFLAAARDLGTGPALSAVGPDAEVTVLLE